MPLTMENLVILWALFALAHAQSTSQIEFTGHEPTIMVVGGGSEVWSWAGGDGVSPIVFTLMQGCDTQDLITVLAMGKVDPGSSGFFEYQGPPDTLVNGGNYWVQMTQSGSTPVYAPVSYTGGGEPKSSTSSCPASTAGGAPSSTATKGVSSQTTSLSSNPPTSSPSQTTGGILTSQPQTSGMTSVSSPTTTTDVTNVGNLIPGVALLTGACTSPLFAYATGGLFSYLYEYPIYGCAGGRPECCPFDAGLVASNSPNYGITRNNIIYIVECPSDYVTIDLPSQTGPGGFAINLCCPSGWIYGNEYIDNYQACYSVLSAPLSKPAPATISYSGDPTYVVREAVTDTVFAMALQALASGPSKKGLSGGAIAGIAVGALSAFFIFGALIWLSFSQRRKRNEFRRSQNMIEENHHQPPDYTAEKIAVKPTLSQATAAAADDTLLNPISSQSSSTRRKPVAADSDSRIWSNEERAPVTSFSAEQAEKARKQRVSELEEPGRQGEEIKRAQIHEIDGERTRASELEGKT